MTRIDAAKKNLILDHHGVALKAAHVGRNGKENGQLNRRDQNAGQSVARHHSAGDALVVLACQTPNRALDDCIGQAEQRHADVCENDVADKQQDQQNDGEQHQARHNAHKERHAVAHPQQHKEAQQIHRHVGDREREDGTGRNADIPVRRNRQHRVPRRQVSGAQQPKADVHEVASVWRRDVGFDAHLWLFLFQLCDRHSFVQSLEFDDVGRRRTRSARHGLRWEGCFTFFC